MPFSVLIVASMPFRGSNNCILALLCAAREKYHQPVPVLAEVDPIAKAKINPVLINAGTNTFHVREITLLHPMDCHPHFDRRGHIQIIEPVNTEDLSTVWTNLG